MAILREELNRQPEIVFAYAHGSFVKEEKFRDLDVGIYLHETQGIFYESDLSYRLTRRLGVEVEVREIQEAPLAFQMAVLRDGKLLFSRDEELRTDFIERVSKRYPEYAHFRNLFLGIEGVRRK
ncbi:MAG: nucleotidyltransferase domain-containing protein [Planctomycetes bacterium]|nr:nucleotidyltransferase domain-containing protein [Planctomycetota bacterium]